MRWGGAAGDVRQLGWMMVDPRLSGRRLLGVLLGGLLISGICAEAVDSAQLRLVAFDQHFWLVVSYLAVWIPLGASIVLSGRWRRSSAGAARAAHRRFRAIDLLWGLSLGLVARAAASVLEMLFFGRSGSGEVTLGAVDEGIWWIFGAIIAPLILAPVIEEIFFRGILLPSIQRSAAGLGERTSRVLSVIVSAVAFALLHLVAVDSSSSALVVGLSTLIFGLVTGVLVATTGRIGGAIVAHITFNALVLLPLLF